MKQSRYVELFETVEVQQTFYQPPQNATLEKWKAQAPASFDFAMKAWQLITHTSSSPTYRRLRKELTDKETKEAGDFRGTSIVKEAWQRTLECAEILKASHILFQCPASFKPTPSNLNNMRKFFESIDRPKNRILCWEPRGPAWTAEINSAICRELQILHVVDPFVSQTVTPNHFYYRMHGRTGWRHEFSDEELEILKSLMPEGKPGRVYFNNVSMTDDAERFARLLQAE